MKCSLIAVFLCFGTTLSRTFDIGCEPLFSLRDGKLCLIKSIPFFLADHEGSAAHAECHFEAFERVVMTIDCCTVLCASPTSHFRRVFVYTLEKPKQDSTV